MAELSRFFNSEVGDVREYPASDFAEYFDKFLSDGIYTDNDSMGLNTTITGFVATVGEGFAFIKGYLYKNDADITFTLSNADAILSRIDRLVLKLDTVNRSMNVIKKEGTLGSNPTAPPLIDDGTVKELPLVRIRVNANASTGIITDERIPVSSIIEIPYEDMSAEFDIWFNARVLSVGVEVYNGTTEPGGIVTGDLWLKEI